MLRGKVGSFRLDATLEMEMSRLRHVSCSAAFLSVGTRIISALVNAQFGHHTFWPGYIVAHDDFWRKASQMNTNRSVFEF